MPSGFLLLSPRGCGTSCLGNDPRLSMLRSRASVRCAPHCHIRQVPPAGGRNPIEVAAPWPFTLPSATLECVATLWPSRTLDRSARLHFRSSARDPPDLDADFPDAFRSLRPGRKAGFPLLGLSKDRPSIVRDRRVRLPAARRPVIPALPQLTSSQLCPAFPRRAELSFDLHHRRSVLRHCCLRTSRRIRASPVLLRAVAPAHSPRCDRASVASLLRALPLHLSASHPSCSAPRHRASILAGSAPWLRSDRSPPVRAAAFRL
jgi:hypothetical protein